VNSRFLNRRRLSVFICIVIIIYFLFYFIYYQMHDEMSKSNRREKKQRLYISSHTCNTASDRFRRMENHKTHHVRVPDRPDTSTAGEAVRRGEEFRGDGEEGIFFYFFFFLEEEKRVNNTCVPVGKKRVYLNRRSV